MATKDSEKAPLFVVKKPGQFVPASAIDAIASPTSRTVAPGRACSSEASADASCATPHRQRTSPIPRGSRGRLCSLLAACCGGQPPVRS